MPLTIVEMLRRTENRRIWLTCRRVTAVASLFVLMSHTTHAGPVLVSQVVQTVNKFQSSVDLRLSNLSQDPVSPDVKVTGATSEPADKSKGGTKTESILSGVAVDSQNQNVGVVVVEDAIIEGTVCDCGEIIVPGGAFPKWPLLFLAAIPLVFIHDCDDCDRDCIVCDVVISPTPTPTPPSNSTVPEPASLFLFGTGLLAVGAGLRRRYAKSKLTTEIKAKDN
jgi:hypothetical protein